MTGSGQLVTASDPLGPVALLLAWLAIAVVAVIVFNAAFSFAREL